VLSHTPASDALDLFAHDLHGSGHDLPGVLGPEPVGRAFAERWRALTGKSCRQAMAMRIYQLTAARPVTAVPGRVRRVTEADRDLLLDWYEAFQREAMGEAVPEGIARSVDQLLTADPVVRGLYVWEDSAPVSMAGYSGPTPHGIRIGPVYTPPEHRRKGYASACVAAVSQCLLDSGRRFCFLFTDLANPTSNRIYQAIGYEPVGDVDEYRFE
jgi:predicted GNAT family acetyltransferase